MRERIRILTRRGLTLLGFTFADLLMPGSLLAQTPAPIPAAMPYTLTFAPQSFPGQALLPAMQNYVEAGSNGRWLVVGGRVQGLHMFQTTPARNFPPASANRSLVVIEPASGKSWSLPLAGFPANIADPLAATGLQGCHDPGEGMFYVAGGYGLDSTTQKMITFPNLIRIPLGPTIGVITDPSLSDAAKVAKLAPTFTAITNDAFAVTGGGLKKVQNRLYLIFGQKFTGDYYAFSSGINQVYTESVRQINLKLDPLTFLSSSDSPKPADPSHPYHRRDGSVVDTIDPDTGRPLFAAFGGVFQVGSTLGYGQPILIDDNQGAPTVTINAAVEQLFSQYECPVVSVYDPTGQAMYHSFFGGISHTYYAQTPTQQAIYELIIGQNRADGVPFIADISTLALMAGGKSAQFLHLDPIAMTPIPQGVIDGYFGKLSPQDRQKYQVTTTNLIGASVDFWADPSLVASGKMTANGVIRLDAFQPGESAVVGYVFGGIAAVFPYALIPSHGTYASNTLFAVTLTKTPSAAWPASVGKTATTNGPPAGVVKP